MGENAEDQQVMVSVNYQNCGTSCSFSEGEMGLDY